MSLAELAEADGVNLDAGNLSRFERGEQGIDLYKLQAISTALGYQMSELYAMAEGAQQVQEGTGNTEAGPYVRDALPLISWVQAGLFQQVEDPYQPGEADDWIPVTKKFSKRSFALRVRGDSMVDPSGQGPSFPPGSIICVEPEASVAHRDFVIVRLENSKEATFKQLIIDGSEVFLKPLNPRYPIMKIDSDAVVCGVVRQMVMDF